MYAKVILCVKSFLKKICNKNETNSTECRGLKIKIKLHHKIMHIIINYDQPKSRLGGRGNAQRGCGF